MASYPSVVEQGTTQRFIELTHDVYASRLDGDLGKTVRIAFTDEPGVPRDAPGRSLAWTADFSEEFRRREKENSACRNSFMMSARVIAPMRRTYPSKR